MSAPSVPTSGLAATPAVRTRVRYGSSRPSVSVTLSRSTRSTEVPSETSTPRRRGGETLQTGGRLGARVAAAHHDEPQPGGPFRLVRGGVGQVEPVVEGGRERDPGLARPQSALQAAGARDSGETAAGDEDPRRRHAPEHALPAGVSVLPCRTDRPVRHGSGDC
ncbi:hypothetical protein GCM10010357_62620 [Streptomyces luteireticuli]|uniref:Uncharacterized protein n=1 Tax=Streptomyces luteireticuli TaxID=173858 RepID=A0ABP3IZR9_9ACTN